VSARRALVGLALGLGLAGMLAGCGGAAGGSGSAGGESVWPASGSRTFSPYVDVTLASPFDLAGVATDTGARSLTLAFVTARAGGCQAAWGGMTAIDAPTIAGPAARLRKAGVALRVSFGGAQGVELAGRCPDTGLLEAAYASVLDRYHAVVADFDLEGAALADRAAMMRRAQAIARLQARSGRALAVSLTVPASPKGLSAAALTAVRAMVTAGVRLSAVNLLAMDYGTAVPLGRMGAAAIAAVSSAHRQLVRLRGGLSGWGVLGVSAMVGVNDTPGEVFTLKDAEQLASFAGRHGLGLVSIWSLARDHSCAGSVRGAADPTCSGVNAPPYAFSQAFGAYPRPGVAPARAMDSS
jgi:hypothetical protein